MPGSRAAILKGTHRQPTVLQGIVSARAPVAATPFARSGFSISPTRLCNRSYSQIANIRPPAFSSYTDGRAEQNSVGSQVGGMIMNIRSAVLIGLCLALGTAPALVLATPSA